MWFGGIGFEKYFFMVYTLFCTVPDFDIRGSFSEVAGVILELAKSFLISAKRISEVAKAFLIVAKEISEVAKQVLIVAGASAPSPDFLFVLTQKGSKKVKPSPASLEKLALSWLNRPNSLLRRSNKTVSNANFTCFLAHWTRSILAANGE